MATFFAFGAVVAAGVLVFLVLVRVPGLRGGLARLASALFWPILVAAGIASAIADFFLTPGRNNRKVVWWKYLAWVAAGLLPMAAFFVLLGRPLALPAPLSQAADPGYLLVAAGLFHVLVLTAALVAAHEDYDVMDGLIADGNRRIGGVRSATRLPVMTISGLFFVAYAVAVIYWLSEIKGLDLFDKRPQTGFAAADYLLIVLWSLPSEILLRPIDWFVGANTEASFKVTVVARAYYLTVYAIGALLLAGLAAVVLQMRRQLRRIVSEIGEGREGEQAYLVARARLAPPIIKRGILNAAISTADRDRQRRLIDAARDLAIFTFPQTFCHYLESYDEEIQHVGLDRSIELFRQRGAEFDREPCQTILRKTGRLLLRGKLGPESVKRVLRLTIAVLTAKRGVVEVDSAYRDRVSAAINKALRKVGAEGDPALRGLLQDVRAALARSVIVKAGMPAPGPVDRGAQPGSPATTAPR